MKKNLFLLSIVFTLILSASVVFAAESYYIPEDDQDPTVENVTCEQVGFGTNLMKKGSTGTSVQILKEVMALNGIEIDTTNGIYDTDTVTAVKFLQAELGITADGIVGPITRSAMRSMCVNAVIGS